jgi:hypothetical protein
MLDHCLELTIGITKYVAYTTQSTLHEWTNKN